MLLPDAAQNGWLNGWIVEEGIGEHRAVLMQHGEAVAALIDWPGRLAAGLISDAILVSRTAGSGSGTAQFPGGELALVSGLPRSASEGSTLRLEVTRAALSERGRGKLARARPSEKDVQSAPTLRQQLGMILSGLVAVPDNVWEDIFTEAWLGEVAFSGGSLVVCPTPAMTLIDVDGTLPAAQLAKAAAKAATATIRLLGLNGNLAIDFPTLADKADRQAVDRALADGLAGWPHERTAMNGFGLVQLVSRQHGPSLVARLHFDRAGAAARLLLRRAERVRDPGVLLLTLHPAVRAVIEPAWEAELARRTGRVLRWQIDAALALDGAFAQAVSA